MMTDMECDYAGQIIEWAFSKYKGIEDITHEQMVNTFWADIFKSCSMHIPVDPMTIIE